MYVCSKLPGQIEDIIDTRVQTVTASRRQTMSCEELAGSHALCRISPTRVSAEEYSPICGSKGVCKSDSSFPSTNDTNFVYFDVGGLSPASEFPVDKFFDIVAFFKIIIGGNGNLHCKGVFAVLVYEHSSVSYVKVPKLAMLRYLRGVI